MPDFIDFCNKFSPLTDLAIEDLQEVATTRVYQKGQHVLENDSTCRHLYYINNGLIKSFFFKDDKEFVMRFFADNVMFSVFDSFITRTPSKFTLVALEDTSIVSISHDAVEHLCKEHHCFETFYRKLVSVACVKMVKRISEMLEGSAAERYEQFVQDNHNIMQRINSGDIAKYLGITQQSLSRIRASY